jgi:hypothetical protein
MVPGGGGTGTGVLMTTADIKARPSSDSSPRWVLPLRRREASREVGCENRPWIVVKLNIGRLLSFQVDTV